MAVAITVTTAIDPTKPHTINVTGAAAGAVFTLTREYGTKAETLRGTLIASAGGTASRTDFMYPLDTPVRYVLRDSATGAIVATSALVPAVDSGGFPWVRDMMFPESRYSPIRIVTVLSRRYAGRVTPFTLINQRYPVTVGDVRSASDGSLLLFCTSHAERDRVIDALSSGNPCSLRVPPACQVVIDEMLFTPLDIDEEMFGSNGANLLTVDFIEVSPSELPPFQAITYGVQTQNAAVAAMTYAGLKTAFAGHTYADLYYSQTGIAP